MNPVDDLEAFDHLLSTTRSVRRKLDFDRPVEPDVIEACIDVATQAPTGLNRENWRFVVVTDPEPKRAIGDLYRGVLTRYESAIEELRGESRPPAYRALADRLHEMPVLILVCALGRPGPTEPALQVGFYGSILPAAWSLMLALRARGLGTTWTTLLAAESEEVARVLGIPEDVTQTVLFPVAYTRDAVLRVAKRRPAREVTFWNRWGAKRPD
jgi:nitroreductase